MYQQHEEHERHGERQEDCGCGGHGEGHHGEHHVGGSHHGHHAMGGGMPHEGCNCSCHQMGGFGHGGMMRRGMGMRMGMSFGRHFISRDEIIGQLEEYLKQLQAETKGVEEHITELKKKGESQQA